MYFSIDQEIENLIWYKLFCYYCDIMHPFVCFQGVDLRQYSKQVETELQKIEQASIKDCIFAAHSLNADMLEVIWSCFLLVF